MQKKYIDIYKYIIGSSIIANTTLGWHDTIQKYQYIPWALSLNEDFTIEIITKTYMNINKGLIFGIFFPITIPCKIYTTLYYKDLIKDKS